MISFVGFALFHYCRELCTHTSILSQQRGMVNESILAVLVSFGFSKGDLWKVPDFHCKNDVTVVCNGQLLGILKVVTTVTLPGQ